MTAPTSQMSKINLVVPPGTCLEEAESQARAAAGHEHPPGALALVAWWDRLLAAGGPSEACHTDTYSSVTSYAKQHGITCMVRVNGGQYDFFYAGIRRAADEVEPETQRNPYQGARPGWADWHSS